MSLRRPKLVAAALALPLACAAPPEVDLSTPEEITYLQSVTQGCIQVPTRGQGSPRRYGAPELNVEDRTLTISWREGPLKAPDEELAHHSLSILAPDADLGTLTVGQKSSALLSTNCYVLKLACAHGRSCLSPPAPRMALTFGMYAAEDRLNVVIGLRRLLARLGAEDHEEPF